MEGKVPIAFNYKGKEYRGQFDPVFGAGGNVWCLMINKYYMSRLRLNDDGWFFDGNKFTVLREYFGDYLTSWYQEHKDSFAIMNAVLKRSQKLRSPLLRLHYKFSPQRGTWILKYKLRRLS